MCGRVATAAAKTAVITRRLGVALLPSAKAGTNVRDEEYQACEITTPGASSMPRRWTAALIWTFADLD
jgi:hypothetical protein